MTRMHSLQRRAVDFVRGERLIETGDHILVAVSGGPDSTALLDLLNSTASLTGAARLTVIHFDHRLRGAASEADLEFVRDLAERLGLSFVSSAEDVDAYRAGRGISLEMASRECRRRFFEETAADLRADRIALGHTADDQAEELLLRLLRGTGPSGMAGMLPSTPTGIIRPILFARRSEIMEYLRDRQISCREDSSNKEPFCRRNFLRLRILPELEKRFRRSPAEALSRHAILARDETDWIDSEIRRLWPDVVEEQTSSRVALIADKVSALHPALQRRILRIAVESMRESLYGISARHIEAARKLMLSAKSGGRVDLPYGMKVTADEGLIVILERGSSPGSVPSRPFQKQIDAVGIHSCGEFEFELFFADSGADRSGVILPASREEARFDAAKVLWPLTVRSWKPGDRFRPLGLQGTKKLQDFFVDAKIPGRDRARIPILCDPEKICWIVGYRPDDRVKIDSSTQRVLVVRARRRAGRE